ncbi:MAG: formylglycine-generating enzyme family protein [Verrucomicrobia bacterium]|nr:MAG: formylglycine-generating enzyme family protein [Verrucomicrobiota bacterium]TAE86381.1 MAG: formylglycine-generating enzyme family protein [Verrucomicrobiota bacterium]TAF24375.1 MAG: formylglycine-generating enzyme family protein [Verrucomicrobiota bacterium]
MVHLPGGSFTMGQDGPLDTPSGPKYFPEEGPAHSVTVDSFWIDETEVTNAMFAEFVTATRYLTFAERTVTNDRSATPLRNGSIIFNKNAGIEGDPNLIGRSIEWWRCDPDANWRNPEGKGSSIENKDDHPVVCVTHEDASAYAKWAGKRLPTEAEWEYAARGGLTGKIYIWGNDLTPNNQWMANTWQGDFPNHNSAEDGHPGSAPVRSFPPNSFGLFDMAGNAWELCNDLYDPTYFSTCSPDKPQGPTHWINRDTGLKNQGMIHRVIKGGSFLCHISYCMRYRPAARHSQDNESPSNHTGFRCVK